LSSVFMCFSNGLFQKPCCSTNSSKIIWIQRRILTVHEIFRNIKDNLNSCVLSNLLFR
jgi:hypothetical protein